MLKKLSLFFLISLMLCGCSQQKVVDQVVNSGTLTSKVMLDDLYTRAYVSDGGNAKIFTVNANHFKINDSVEIIQNGNFRYFRHQGTTENYIVWD